MRYVLSIEGMSCEHCVKHATNALKEIPGVTKVVVTLSSKSAEVEAEAEIGAALFKDAIDEAGFELVSIK